MFSLQFWYGLGSLLATLYGIVHLLFPHTFAQSWQGVANFTDESVADFARLLGIWILFQAAVAYLAMKIKDPELLYPLTVIHFFKNFGAMSVRIFMGLSGRYLINPAFILSICGDLIFVIGYGYYCLFPSLALHQKSAQKVE